MDLTKEELCEIVLDLNKQLIEIQYQFQYGISLHPTSHEALEITYPNPVIRKEVMQDIFMTAHHAFEDLISMRYHTSISGAMRNENSQEAAIVSNRLQFRYL